jgi:hypothetical protein
MACFHQLLERLDNKSTSFFHEVMDTLESDETGDSAATSVDDAIHHLWEILQKLEDKKPTFSVNRFDNHLLFTKNSLFHSSGKPQNKSNINSLDKCEDIVQDTSFNFIHQLLLTITLLYIYAAKFWFDISTPHRCHGSWGHDPVLSTSLQ